MKAKAIHRSLIFWFGIFVMAFLCWSWSDSTRYRAYIVSGPFFVVHETSLVGFGYIANEEGNRCGRDKVPRHLLVKSMPPPFLLQGKGADGDSLPAWIGRFQPAFARDWVTNPRGSWGIDLPHWLLFVCVVLLWLALLRCRSKWVKRASAASPTKEIQA